jgi:hypothetical protein
LSLSQSERRSLAVEPERDVMMQPALVHLDDARHARCVDVQHAVTLQLPAALTAAA